MKLHSRMGDELKTILSLVHNPKEGDGPNSSLSQDKADAPNWSASLDLVHQTAEAIRAGADRVRKVEARSQALLQRMAKELQSTQARIETLEAQLSASETRAKQAETRAKETEAWLRRIHNAMAEELPASLSLLEAAGGADA